MLKTSVLLSSLASAVQSVDVNEIKCMTQAIYFEARGEPWRGKQAVANVIINRTRLNRYPSSVCEVIAQPYQFSYRNNDDWRRHKVQLHVPEVRRAVVDSFSLAVAATTVGIIDITRGATHFVNLSKSTPSWYLTLEHKGKFGAHDMFKE